MTTNELENIGTLIEKAKSNPNDPAALAELKKALPRETWNYCFGKPTQPRASRNSLLTQEVIRKFERTPLYSQEGKGLDAKLLVKYFNPAGSGTWLITEAEKQENGDYLLFGLAKIQEWEWGYTLLSDLEKYRGTVSFIGGGFNGEKYTGIRIERDRYASGTVRENMTAEELEEYSYFHSH